MSDFWRLYMRLIQRCALYMTKIYFFLFFLIWGVRLVHQVRPVHQKLRYITSQQSLEFAPILFNSSSHYTWAMSVASPCCLCHFYELDCMEDSEQQHLLLLLCITLQQSHQRIAPLHLVDTIIKYIVIKYTYKRE